MNPAIRTSMLNSKFGRVDIAKMPSNSDIIESLTNTVVCLFLPILTLRVPEVIIAEFKLLHFRPAKSQNWRLKYMVWEYLGHRYKTTSQCPASQVFNFYMSVSQRHNNLDLTAFTVSEDKMLHQRQVRPTRLALFTTLFYDMERELRWTHRIKKALYVRNERLRFWYRLFPCLYSSFVRLYRGSGKESMP